MNAHLAAYAALWLGGIAASVAGLGALAAIALLCMFAVVMCRQHARASGR